MNITLDALLAGLDARITGPRRREIAGLSLSSSQVVPGGMFVALVGTRADGHAYIDDAIRRGAGAVVMSRSIDVPEGVTRILVPDTRVALTVLAARFFGDPSRSLTLVGITGTNGKTTTTYLLEAIFAAAGRTPGVIGTVNYRFRDRVLPAPNTTPDLVVMQGLLAQMLEADVDTVVSEVSSHALDQRRVDGLQFTAALFTNLSRDHLDYHVDLESYFAAKARLFEEVLAASTRDETLAVINQDDAYGRRLKARAKARTVWGFSRTGDPQAELRVVDARLDLNGIHADVVTPVGRLELRSPLLGPHNLENLLGAAGIALGLGIPAARITEALAACRRVPGRLEEVPNPLGIKVLVDYAHSDDALSRVLSCLRPMTTGALITVFGCGGERDRGKRPLMGRVAASASELTLVTTDNPRGEAPEAIVAEILPGLHGIASAWQPGEPLERGRSRYATVIDRREAIRTAIAAARPGDVVLIAGKGHEDYQLVGQHKLYFDDREEAGAAMQQTGGG